MGKEGENMKSKKTQKSKITHSKDKTKEVHVPYSHTFF